MKSSDKLRVSTPSDTEILLERDFDAPPRLVFAAYTEPAIVRRWLGVFGGIEMTECVIDLRVGGGFRFFWEGPDDFRMGMRGTYLEIAKPDRLVSTEKFDEAWYEG